MVTLFWKIVAWIVSRPRVVDWLIARAVKTPYDHIPPHSGEYMERYWLFNPYPSKVERDKRKAQGLPPKDSWLPSIRLHKIMRADLDQHPHDHPWDARTIILRNMYMEERLEHITTWDYMGFDNIVPYTRRAGSTATLRFGEFHRITYVPPEGVWTLFITFSFKGMWGFLVNNVKVPYQEYNNGNH